MMIERVRRWSREVDQPGLGMCGSCWCIREGVDFSLSEKKKTGRHGDPGSPVLARGWGKGGASEDRWRKGPSRLLFSARMPLVRKLVRVRHG